MKKTGYSLAAEERLVDLDRVKKALISIDIPITSIEAALSIYLDAAIEVDPQYAKDILAARRESTLASESLLRAVREAMILRSIKKYLADPSLVTDYVRSKDISHEANPVLYGRIRADIMAV